MSGDGQGRGAEPYWWGRLFVRSATVLAVVVLAVTVIAVLVQIVWLRRTPSETAYQPSEQLVEEFAALTESWRQTEDLLAAHFGLSVVPTEDRTAFPDVLENGEDLLQAKRALAVYEDAGAEMKQKMVSRFAEASDWLLASMDRKAEKIRDHIVQQHLREAEDLQLRIEALRTQLGEGRRGLYASMTQAQVAEREQIIDQALDFFGYLGELTQSDTVQLHIDAAVDSLGRMREMLPEPASESQRLGVVSRMTQLRRRRDTLLKQGNKLEGEQLAERLAQLQSEVIEAVQMSWAVEGDVSRLATRLEAEVQRAEDARTQQQYLVRMGFVRLALTLTAGLVLSFMLVVVADVLRALFDAAFWMSTVHEGPGVRTGGRRAGVGKP